MHFRAILLFVNVACPAFAFDAAAHDPEPRLLPAPQICVDCPVQSALIQPTTPHPPIQPNISGNWSADLSCSVGAGRYIYTFRQLRDGHIIGTSQGVSFGVQGITGILVSGRIAGGHLEFLEQVSDRYAISFFGTVEMESGVFSGEYLNSRSGETCRIAMKKMRDPLSGDRM